MKLTDAEREAMWQAHTQQGPHFNRLVMTVERIVAARLEQQREDIAAAIETAPIVWSRSHSERLAAARVVREYQPGEDT